MNKAIKDLFEHRGIASGEAAEQLGLTQYTLSLYKKFYDELVLFAEEELQIGEDVRFDVNRIEKLDKFDVMADTLAAICVNTPFTEDQAKILFQAGYTLAQTVDITSEDKEQIPIYLKCFAENVAGLTLAELLALKAQFELDRYFEKLLKMPSTDLARECTVGKYAMMVRAGQALDKDVALKEKWLEDEATVLRLLSTDNLLDTIVERWRDEISALDTELIWATQTIGGAAAEKTEAPCQNTRVEYTYTDADNYKCRNHVIVKGILEYQDIQVILGCRRDEEFFIPEWVDFPGDIAWDYDPQADHPWWRLDEDSFSIVEKSATVDMTAQELVDKFCHARDNDWGCL